MERTLPADRPLFAPAAAAIKAAGRYIARMLYDWHARARDRAHLASLDARLLNDMGLTRGDAMREGAKPFWRP
jgi:uncharacterized protein YjiS (DUF1127 family)